jgi:hypothetical protein
MNGDQNSEQLSAEEKLARADKLLDEYEDSIGLSRLKILKNEHAINEYLSYTRDEIQKLSSDRCAEIAYEIAAYSFHLQRSINRQISRVGFCEAEIRRELAIIIKEFSHIYSYEERKYTAIASNSYTTKLQQIKDLAQSRIDRLGSIQYNLKMLCDSLKTLSYSKREQ